MKINLLNEFRKLNFIYFSFKFFLLLIYLNLCRTKSQKFCNGEEKRERAKYEKRKNVYLNQNIKFFIIKL